MATAYAAPIPAPEIVVSGERYDFNAYQAREDKYLNDLREMARKRVPGNPLVGEILRWGRGDGYAQYMVWNTKPLQLVWLEIGDAWSIEDALIRGLNLTDVKRMVEGERRLRELFAKKETSK
jgi:hypothetical protein